MSSIFRRWTSVRNQAQRRLSDLSTVRFTSTCSKRACSQATWMLMEVHQDWWRQDLVIHHQQRELHQKFQVCIILQKAQWTKLKHHQGVSRCRARENPRNPSHPGNTAWKPHHSGFKPRTDVTRSLKQGYTTIKHHCDLFVLPVLIYNVFFHFHRSRLPNAHHVDSEPRNQSIPTASLSCISQWPDVPTVLSGLQLQLHHVAGFGRHGDRVAQRVVQITTRPQEVVEAGRLHCEYRDIVAFYIFFMHQIAAIQETNLLMIILNFCHESVSYL